MPEPFRHTLISSRLNVNAESFDVTSREAAPRCPVDWAARKRRLRGGRQEGVDLVELRCGEMVMRIVPTRGMSILDVRVGDVRLGWDSPVNEVVHPMFIQPHNRGGLGWLEGFNEYLARCGLEWFGPPAEDVRHHARAEPPAGNLTLHGKIGNIPASEVELVAETAPPYRLTLRGLVRERSLFGPKLDLHTAITIEPGRDGFEVADGITNAGGQSEEFALLYHVNHGRPLLEEGARFIAPARRVTPISDRAAEGIAEYDTYLRPTTGYAEQVYMLELYGDRAGGTRVMLRNGAGDRAVSMAYSTRELPCFTLWKNTAAEADGYVTGLEPGTGYPNPRPLERKAQRIPKLRPGRTYTAAVSYAVHLDRSSVRSAAKRIEAIRRGRKTQVDEAPPGV